MARLLIGNFKGQQGLQGEKGDDGVIDSNSVIDFEDYTENTPPSPDTALRNILTGHSISDLLSNIKAFLKNALTTDKIANNLATTDTTMVLGAAMGKQLGDSVNTLNTNLTTTINTLNNNAFVVPTLRGNATAVFGGYNIIGKKVVINIAVTTSNTNLNSIIVSGFPISKTGHLIPLSAIQTSDGSMRATWLNGSGEVVTSSGGGVQNIAISGEYIIS